MRQGVESSCCEFEFTKIMTKEAKPVVVDSICGTLEVKQEAYEAVEVKFKHIMELSSRAPGTRGDMAMGYDLIVCCTTSCINEASEACRMCSSHFCQRHLNNASTCTFCLGAGERALLDDLERSASSLRISDAVPVDGYYLNCHIQQAVDIHKKMDFDMCYDMTTEHKGPAFILNLHYYECTAQEPRRGSPKDVANIRHVLTEVGFHVPDELVHQDLTVKEIKSRYKEFITMCRNFKTLGCLKCIAVVLMAHGGYGYIKCQTKELDEEKLKLSFFFSTLERELVDVPKIFIILACRQEAASFEDYSVQPPSDHTIRIYSTTKGTGSTRDFNKGSIFIQALVKTILENGHREHLKDMITMLKNCTEELRKNTPYRNNVMEIPDYEENLRKKLYLLAH